jgi:hypothetical protein
MNRPGIVGVSILEENKWAIKKTKITLGRIMNIGGCFGKCAGSILKCVYHLITLV